MNRLKDNGDGTVTDLETGLMWQKGTAEGRYTWEEALKYCEDLKLAGYSDWRVPDRRELESLLDLEKSNPAIDTDYFPNTQNDWYWSSSSYASDTKDAWGVFFYNGDVISYGKGDSYYVRAVRGGQEKG